MFNCLGFIRTAPFTPDFFLFAACAAPFTPDFTPDFTFTPDFVPFTPDFLLFGFGGVPLLAVDNSSGIVDSTPSKSEELGRWPKRLADSR